MSPGHLVPCRPAEVVFALCLASRRLRCTIVKFKCGRSSLFKFVNNITKMVVGAEGPTRAYGLVRRPCFAGERSTWSQVGRVQQRRRGGVVGAASPVSAHPATAQVQLPAFDGVESIVRRRSSESCEESLVEFIYTPTGGSRVTTRVVLSRGVRQSRVRTCLLYTSPSPRDRQKSRMPSSA